MKRLIRFSHTALFVILVTSCSFEKDPQKIFEEQQTGVCMVLNSYYYEIVLPNGTMWYCNGIDEDGYLQGLTLDESDIQKNKTMMTGTAFFIDEKGTLLTNRHVVNPTVSEDVIKKAAEKFLSNIREFLNEARQEFAVQYHQLEASKSECYEIGYYGYMEVNKSRLMEIEDAQQTLSDKFDEYSEAVNQINQVSLSAIRVTPRSEIGIAYNDTYVTTIDDFLKNNPCVVTKVSKDEDVDLAKIQLKNKTTPSGKFVFKIKGINDDGGHKFIRSLSKDASELTIGTKLLMIGFNAGLVLGNTRQGIQAQMTKGDITQTPDGTRLLYSIPALQGSSGSPVIDYYGYVRAVNFAKLAGTDSFNFGIPEKKIKIFLEE